MGNKHGGEGRAGGSGEADNQANSPANTKTKQKQKTVRLLLFGTGEGGKTTLLRQLKHEHLGEKGVAAEIASSRGDICFNVVEGTYLTVMAAQNLFNIKTIPEDLRAPVVRAYDEFFKNIDSESGKINLDDENLVQTITTLYTRADFLESLDRRNEFQLHDGWIYQANKLTKDPKWPRWGGARWEPEMEDLVHARIRTMGMQFCNFMYENMKYKVIDIGGQRSEREKFFRKFQKVDTVLFVASLSEYDQKLFEDEQVNRLKESLRCFRNAVNHADFKDCWFVLILNKVDIFKHKYKKRNIPLPTELHGKPLAITPPLAKDDDEDCSLAIRWFADIFKNEAEDEKRRSMIRHYTCTAINQEEVLNTMENVTTFLHEKYLQ